MPTGVYQHKKGYKRPTFSQEWKDSIRESHIGKNTGKDNPFYGKHHSEETKEKIRKGIAKRFPNGRSQELHPNWKGNSVGYVGLHYWVVKQLGQPLKCEHCNADNLRPRQYQWANKSRTYKRELSDWIRLCVKCHAKYDGVSENMKIKMVGNTNSKAIIRGQAPTLKAPSGRSPIGQ